MKKFQSISSILEQENTKVSFTITDTAVSPKNFIKLQWTYTYAWPKKSPGMGVISEIAKAIETSTKGDGKLILDEIIKSPGSIVGISREAGNTANNRLLAADQLVTTGFVYIFNANTIDIAKVPVDKRLGTNGKIGQLEAFEVDANFPKYRLTGTPVNQVANQSGQPAPTKTGVKVEDFLTINSKYSNWYNSKVRLPYLQPVLSTIGSTEAPIRTSAKMVRLFWKLVEGAGSPYQVDAPSTEAGLSEFSRILQSALQKIIADAKKYDPTLTADDAVDVLDAGVFKSVLNGLILIGLNTGKITTGPGGNIENEVLPADYTKMLDAVKVDTKFVNQVTTSTGTAAEATANFDGTAVNNETDLAKILSGLFVARNVDKTKIDTIDKVKAMWNSSAKTSKWTTLDDAWDNTVKTLPWKKGSAPASVWFGYIQKLAIKTTGQYGPQTIAGFLTAFKNSAF